MIRHLVRRLLVAGVPEFGGRVYEPQAVPGAETAKPFGVIRERQRVHGDPWATQGAAGGPTAGAATNGDQTAVLEVWPYVERASLRDLDHLAAACRTCLDRQTVQDDADGAAYLLEYDGVDNPDAHDEAWDGLTRPVRFLVWALAWAFPETWTADDGESPGDVVRALRDWTRRQYPPGSPLAPLGVQTDPRTWQPADDRPGVYWRVVQVGHPPDRELQWGTWQGADLRGHVVCPTAGARRAWVRRLADRLAVWPRFTMPDGSPAFLDASAGEPDGDPWRIGQLALTVRYGVNAAAPPPWPPDPDDPTGEAPAPDPDDPTGATPGPGDDPNLPWPDWEGPVLNHATAQVGPLVVRVDAPAAAGAAFADQPRRPRTARGGVAP